MNKERKLNIVQWNIRSVYAHLAELKNFINKYDIDIICLQETFLKPHQTLNIKGYSVERKDRDSGTGGGILLCIKNSIKYNKIDTDLEAFQCIDLYNNRKSKIRLIHGYIRPLEAFDYKELEPLLLNTNTIILGDFNAHSELWSHGKTNSAGKLLESFLQNKDLTLLNDGQGTYLYHTGKESSPDVTLATSDLYLNSTWKAIKNNMRSDHFPIIISVNAHADTDLNTIERYSFKKTNWEKYKEDSSKYINNTLNSDSNQQFYDNLVSALTELAKKHCTKTSSRNKQKRVPYWDNNCKEAVKKRNKLYKQYRKTKEQETCIEYKKAKAETQKIIRNTQAQYWETYCNSLTDTSKLSDVWKRAKSMTGKKASTHIPVIKQNSSLYITDIEKAEAFGSYISKASSSTHFDKKFLRHRAQRQKKWESTIVNDNPALQHLNTPFQLHELRTALSQCKNNSAPGEDQITYEMLKHLSNTAMKYILELYNKLWRDNTLPAQWKESIVIPILKSGQESSNINSYRPISLTATMCKLMERLVTNRLIWHLEKNNILTSNQTGFRKYKNSIDQLLRLHDDANKSLITGQYTSAIMLDFTKAFDLLWREGLMYKIRKQGLSGNIYNFINNFLTDRSIKVRIGNTHSQNYKLENGTPQGSVISPLLFILMINDFPTSNDIKTSLYADDSCIWKNGSNIKYIQSKLQIHLNKITNWCNKWGFIISPKKPRQLFSLKRNLTQTSGTP